MRARWAILPIVFVVAAFLSTAHVAAGPIAQRQSSAPAAIAHRCEKDYDQPELDALIADGEDGYEPDDCPLLSHTLTGPEKHNFCLPGDEDWVRFKAKPNLIYEIATSSPENYPTEPHLELIEDGVVIDQNDHYFGNNAAIWLWNGETERTLYVRVIELAGRAECGNNEYTLSLHSFTERP